MAAAGERKHPRRTALPGSREAARSGEPIPLRDRGQDLLLGHRRPGALRRPGAAPGAGAAGNRGGPARPWRGTISPTKWRTSRRRPRAAPDPGVELARHTSAPLLEDLRITDKVSQNLHAELALRAVARARRGIGSFEAGREELKAFLGEAGIDAGAYALLDGSGLSRLDLVTPAAVVKLLRYMFDSPARDNWISLLPVARRDGTLSTRFGDSPAAGRVHAKTGTLEHVSALSGYVERTDGRWVAFSILVNNYLGPASGNTRQ